MLSAEPTVALRTALRILTAVIEKRQPDPTDLATLRREYPLLTAVPIDAMARAVIRDATTKR